MVTKAKGIFDKTTVEAYLTDYRDKDDPDRSPICDNSDVTYFYSARELGDIQCYTGTVNANGKATLGVPQLAEVLYLDVGCWAGNGPKSAANHARHREFGVVCGNIAVLCSYSRAKFEGDAITANAEPLVKKHPLFKDKIVPLLNHLSSSRDKAQGLGDVEVLSALIGHDPRCTELDTDTLRVFLGDLHLPMITQESDTYISKAGVNLGPDEVLSCGRLRMNAQVKALVAGIAAAAGFEVVAPLAVAVPPVAAMTAVSAASIPAMVKSLVALETLNAPKGIESDGVMSRQEAREWFTYYHGNPGKKGADIFQGAAADLEKLIDLLRDRPASIGKVKLTQLGDVNDFWIGMKCGFGELVSKNPGTDNFFADWYNRVKRDSKTGKVVRLLEGLQKDYVLPTTLLYGNHDNYYRGQRFASDGDKDGHTYWAEHGHQSDSFNCDENATLGWALTQAAFLEPSVREAEDPVAALMCTAERLLMNQAYPARLERIARGADVCCEHKKQIYVMGHTHNACLRRVKVTVGFDERAFDEYRYTSKLREAEQSWAQTHETVRLLKQDVGNSLDAVSAAAVAAKRKLIEACNKLVLQQLEYVREQRAAHAKRIEAARVALQATVREASDLAAKATNAVAVGEKASSAARVAMQTTLENISAKLLQDTLEDAVAAKLVLDAALQAAEAERFAYLRRLEYELERAKKAARASCTELGNAGRWLQKLPGQVKSDLQGRAEKVLARLSFP